MIPHAQTHSVNEISFFPLPPHKAHQGIQLHTNPSAKGHKVKREKQRIRKDPGGRSTAFNTIIQSQVLQLVEFRCSRSCSLLLPRFPFWANISMAPKKSLKGVWHDQLSRKECKNKRRGGMFKEK